MKEANLLSNLKSGENSSVKFIYKQYRNEGISFLQKMGLSDQDTEDVFQDAIISLLLNIKAGKFRSDSKIKTYLFSIMKFKAFSLLGNKKLAISSIEGLDFKSAPIEEYNEEPLNNIIAALNKIDDTCKTLLTGYYFDKEDLKTIADKLSLTYNFIRQKKMRCLKNLKSIYEGKIANHGHQRI